MPKANSLYRTSYGTLASCAQRMGDQVINDFANNMLKLVEHSMSVRVTPSSKCVVDIGRGVARLRAVVLETLTCHVSLVCCAITVSIP